MKIEPKDVKKYLSTKGKVVVTAKHANSLAKTAVAKVRKGFKKALATVREKAILAKDGLVNVASNTKDKIVDNVTNVATNIKDSILPSEEIIQAKTEEVREKRIQKVDTKRYELYQLKNELEKDDEYRIGENQYYLNEIKNELKKLDKKRINVSSKGLSIFSLAKLSVSKVKNGIVNKWNKHKEIITEKKREKEFEKQKLRLAEIIKEHLRLEDEARKIVDTNPVELNKFVNELVRNYNDKTNTETTNKTL